jgi:hypothetical protein
MSLDANEALFELALRCREREQHTATIKCLLGIMENDPLPDIKCKSGLLLVDMYIKYTENVAEARSVLNSLVRGLATSMPRLMTTSKRFELETPDIGPLSAHPRKGMHMIVLSWVSMRVAK